MPPTFTLTTWCNPCQFWFGEQLTKNSSDCWGTFCEHSSPTCQLFVKKLKNILRIFFRHPPNIPQPLAGWSSFSLEGLNYEISNLQTVIPVLGNNPSNGLRTVWWFRDFLLIGSTVFLGVTARYLDGSKKGKACSRQYMQRLLVGSWESRRCTDSRGWGSA